MSVAPAPLHVQWDLDRTEVAVRPLPLPPPAALAVEAEEALGMYLREVAQFPLLNAAEERRLAREIQAGRAGAMVDLVQANLRLVVNLARKATGYGVPLLDLVQEGNVGLMRAAQLFDPGRGVRFSTYATWWVRQAIGRAVIDQSRTIRLPPPLHDLDVRVRKTQARLSGELGREATLAEVSGALEVPLRKLENLVVWTRPPSSLQAPIGEDGEDALLQGLLPDPAAVDPLERVLARALRSEIDQLLGSLSARERSVMTSRFGLDDRAPRTLAEVGRRLGVTRQRVQQIEEEALVKLRQPTLCARLRDFV